MATHALERHVALVGFMGAGKTTLGRTLAERLGRPFVDTDEEILRLTGAPIAALFEQRGEAEAREAEERAVREALARRDLAVVALGGGAVTSDGVRTELARRAFTIHLDVDAEEAWQRAGGTGDRPLAADRERFLALYGERRPLYADVREATVETGDLDGAILAAAGVRVESGALARLGELVPAGAVALVTDPRVDGVHGADAQLALGTRLAGTHELPAGGEAKSLAAVGDLLTELAVARDGAVVALGGGSVTDAAGFAAAVYLRGVAWVPVPTTLVGQVDAAIGGKTGVDAAHAKNLVGAFHWPARTVIDPALLATLPADERLNGLAEVVKTGLLAGEPLWELPEVDLVRRCAAYKAAVCLQDPLDRGPRAVLNLGHTFAHALEAASGYELPHGRAVALGLRAALRLSGVDGAAVDELLHPRPARVPRERAWAALRRDKKVTDGRVRLVLLDALGKPRIADDVPEAEVRRALDELIAD